jgi:hypothetical protein
MTGALLHTSGSGVRQLLFLGASVSQLDPIRHAGELGFTVVAVDADPDAVCFAEADEGVAADFSDVEQVVQIARRRNVSGIVAVSTDRAVPVAARVSEVLGLPGIGVETARSASVGLTSFRRHFRTNCSNASPSSPSKRLTLSVSRKALAFHNCWSLRARYSSWRLQRESRQGRWPIWSDSGIDLVEIAVRRAVGEEITEEQRTPKFNQPLAVRTASPGPLPVGRIRSIGPSTPFGARRES